MKCQLILLNKTGWQILSNHNSRLPVLQNLKLDFFKQDLTRLPAKAQMPSGKGSSWFIESPNIFHLRVTRPPEICVNLVFNLNIFMLLAVTQSIDNLVHSYIVLCENEYFLISNLH